MLTIIVLLLIVAGLVLASLAGISVLWPLSGGLIALCCLCLYHKIELPVIGRMLLLDMKLPLNTLFVFLSIGAVTASWRASGTIGMIIAYGAKLINPKMFVPACFWLSAGVSMLLGTAFGTAGTVGLILMVMARAGGINTTMAAGAIISGIFVGDVASPMSSSTNLIAIMTKCSIHKLVRRLLKSVVLPFIITSLLFLLLSHQEAVGLESNVLSEEMGQAFVMNLWVLLPVIVVLALMLCRVRVSRAITVSCLTASLVAWLVQGQAPAVVLKTLVLGYTMPEGASLKAIMDGGGIMSMVKSEMILILSAMYSGLFKGTGMLAPIRQLVRRVAEKAGRTTGVTMAAFLTCLFAPSQVFAVMMTNQFAASLFDVKEEAERENLGYGIASTAMLFSPLVPWNICSMVPAAMLGVGQGYIPVTFYPMTFIACYALFGWLSWRKRGRPILPPEEKTVIAVANEAAANEGEKQC